LPASARDLLRRIEYRYVIAPRARHARAQQIDGTEAMAIAARLAALASPPRILVADDAVDSGITLATVLRLLREIAPARSEVRSAAITQTLEHPTVQPDYVLFHRVLCRFPWSFDATG
jgi:hypoxanthine phosphoribosyltransferase